MIQKFDKYKLLNSAKYILEYYEYFNIDNDDETEMLKHFYDFIFFKR